VSKVHARLQRIADQLLLQDLGSSNGTFLNGARVTTGLLKDGDVISLAGVEAYRVKLQFGEVTAPAAALSPPEPALEAPAHDRPQFSVEWKTRLEWDSGEMRELAELQRLQKERDGIKEAQRGRTQPAPVREASPAVKPKAAVAAAPVVRPAPTPAAVPAQFPSTPLD